MSLRNGTTIAILGRQPALGLAELESLYGDAVSPFGYDMAHIDLASSDINFDRLGGSMKLANIIGTLPSTWKDIETTLLSTMPKRAAEVESKLSFGISAYGLKANPKAVAKTALLLKKAIKATGKSVRMVPHKEKTLGSAVVLHNKLTRSNGWEIMVVSDGDNTYLALTTNVQNINAYTARDRERPKRDAKVGMLPPKLAQIIINLASGKAESAKTSDSPAKRILDPFCGTGVVLQEATLMNYDVLGSDIDPRMVQYTIDNLQWIRSKYPDRGDYMRVEIGDATRFKWQMPIDTIATETFLGHPLASLPSGDHLSKIIYEANVINHRFLMNLAPQLQTGTRICVAVPAWRGKHEFLHLPMLDHLTDMGYTRARFKHAADEDLIYHRDGQVVGRELLVLEKR